MCVYTIRLKNSLAARGLVDSFISNTSEKKVLVVNYVLLPFIGFSLVKGKNCSSLLS